MKIYGSVEEIQPPLQSPIVTLGNFDGVHRGHQHLIHQVIACAKRCGRPSLLLTFEPHPLKIIRPDSAPPLIQSHSDRMSLIRSCGIEHALVLPFSKSFADMPAETFVQDILHLGLRASVIYVGNNFNFGKARQGTVELLREMSKTLGYEVPVVEDFLVLGSPVSSSRIRRAVASGEVELARELLGRPYSISGKVVDGDRRGADLGFPTANLQTDAELVPADGVYATRAVSHGKIHDAVTNVGSRPTFKGASFAIETHALNSPGDLYGKAMEVQFFGRLRSEVKFESVKKLQQQITIDVQRARRFFADEMSRD